MNVPSNVLIMQFQVNSSSIARILDQYRILSLKELRKYNLFQFPCAVPNSFEKQWQNICILNPLNDFETETYIHLVGKLSDVGYRL